MPWEVRASGKQYCVYKEGEDNPIEGGCHVTEDEANAQLEALNANTEESKATPDAEDDPDEEPAGESNSDPEDEEEDEEEPEEEAGDETKAATLLSTVEAGIHRDFTVMADGLYADGRMTREERISFSSAIGAALNAFTAKLQELLPPEVLNRSPWSDAPMAASSPSKEALDAILLRDMWMATKGMAGPIVEGELKSMGVQQLPDSLAVKALGRSRVGGYLCLWGSEEAKDLTGEWFASDTEELTEIFGAVGAVPLLYHHAGDAQVKSAVVGVVDVMVKDDVGLWIEAQVKKHQEYNKFIRPLVDRRLLGFSSGTLPRARQVDKSTGKILRWPVAEASMTPTPAEWRMVAQWPVQNLKAIYQQAGLQLKDGRLFDSDAEQLEREAEVLRLLAL